MTYDLLIVTWNRLEYFKQTVGALMELDAYKNCERLIIVDNHSTEEGYEEFLQTLQQYKKVFVLRRPQNDGWGMAAQEGLGISFAEYVFLINNDVSFTPNFHTEMLKVFTANPLGLLAGWRHTAHTVTVRHDTYDEMTDIPAVVWLTSKEVIMATGALPMHGPCLTKGGNGEDSAYVNRVRDAGYQVGAMKQDVCTHITGY